GNETSAGTATPEDPPLCVAAIDKTARANGSPSAGASGTSTVPFSTSGVGIGPIGRRATVCAPPAARPPVTPGAASPGPAGGATCISLAKSAAKHATGEPGSGSPSAAAPHGGLSSKTCVGAADPGLPGASL